LSRDSDTPDWFKILLFAISIPAWWLTANGQSITDFYQPWCEASNNEFLTNYKLWVEIAVLGYIMLFGFFSLIKRGTAKRKQVALVGIALLLFLTLFASTEYISSVTGIYEVNLYSLFILPVFLVMIIFSITNLKIFAFRTFGTQLLIYVLLVMVGSQFFFLQSTTYRALTLITFTLSLFLGSVLVRNIHREEQLALELEIANEGQSQLIHFINHQIKGFLGKARIVFSELLVEPEYGPITEPAKKYIAQGESFTKDGVDFVQQILRASNIEKGTFVYDMQPFDMKEVVEKESESKKASAEDKGLQYSVDINEGDYHTKGDVNQIREAVKNLIDNAINYTPKGSIHIQLERSDNKIILKVIDTGLGISDELKPKLFTKGGRDKDSIKINVNSTGFGLSIVKNIVDAHKGRVWAESPGVGKGSTFYLELPVA
jgi:signal transduction histidine kinase